MHQKITSPVSDTFFLINRKDITVRNSEHCTSGASAGKTGGVQRLTTRSSEVPFVLSASGPLVSAVDEEGWTALWNFALQSLETDHDNSAALAFLTRYTQS